LEQANLLEIKDVDVSYGAVSALRNVTVDIKKGEIVALVGANGAGKSALLKAVLGLAPIVKGSIFYNDKDITNKKTENIVASGISLVPEGRGILPLMTVLENLQLGAYQLHGDIRERLEQVYQLFPILKKRSKQLSGTLSGGEQQMLSIGRGMMSKPVLIMLDEPSLGLAPVAIKELFNVFPRLIELGHTILLSEQNVRMALNISDRGYVFQTGEMVYSGTSEELKEHKKLLQSYIGSVI
jgi:branched-chain amino acid transport system ATP-binding protein